MTDAIYETGSNRFGMRGLEVILPRKSNNEPIHIVVDSTGLKVHGEGEWKVRQHGYTKRRTWRKLHLAVDESGGQIEAVGVTTNGISDGEMLEKSLGQVRGEIKQVSEDGGYDRWDCYKEISKKEAVATILPSKGDCIQIHGNSTKQRLARDENILSRSLFFVTFIQQSHREV